MAENQNHYFEWKGYFRAMIPPRSWRTPVIILLGILIGLAMTAFHISNASSYLSDEPTACVNCHIMTPQYATWQHNSHREWTNCNDCHIPHTGFVNKYLAKASDGIRHATMFTLRLEPQVIRLKEAGKEIVQENCLRCHINTLNPVSAKNVTGENYKHGEGKLCWECHREVPHGRISSQTSTPNAMVPSLKSVLPEWMKKFQKSNTN